MMKKEKMAMAMGGMRVKKKMAMGIMGGGMAGKRKLSKR